MAINITISNKATYVFLAVILLLVGVGVVYAYNGNYVTNLAEQLTTSGVSPSIHGHTPDEVKYLEDAIAKLYPNGNLYPQCIICTNSCHGQFPRVYGQFNPQGTIEGNEGDAGCDLPYSPTATDGRLFYCCRA